MQINEIVPKFLPDTMQTDLEEGILYISEKYNTAIHLCACGCKEKTVTPIIDGEWTLSKNEDNTVSLSPSIGNFTGENPYHAHYHITNNKIVWC